MAHGCAAEWDVRKVGAVVSVLARVGTPPGRLPVVGHGLRWLQDPLAVLGSLAECGDLARLQLGPLDLVMVCSAELTRQVLLDDRTFDREGVLAKRVSQVMGEGGLITATRATHRHRRRLTQPVFHRSRLPGYARTMTAQASVTTAGWRDGQTLDVMAEMLGMTTAVAVETLFSGSADDAIQRQAKADFGLIMEGAYRRILLPPLLFRVPRPRKRRFDQAMVRLQRTVDAWVADTRASGARRPDLLSALVASSEADNGLTDREALPGLTDREVAVLAMEFLGAGAETTASVLAWSLHLLGGHPTVSARLWEEVDSVLNGASAELKHLPQLVMTTRVVMEAMRLYPPGWTLFRGVTRQVTLGGHVLPAGTAIACSPYVLHRREDVFDAPDRFHPERWNPEACEQPDRHAFIPFGDGARKCIGEEYGLTEAVLALATIAGRWQLEPVPGAEVRAAAATVLRPRSLPMRAFTRARR
ncbi:cytochrome P450 [Streptomyces toxytricini]|uniref:cytochrome P450 n=1 Tax=Streptomyces toxytricini TaxID=67369 RepID=UPI003425C935